MADDPSLAYMDGWHADGPDAGVERYSDRADKLQKNDRSSRPPLLSVLTLLPVYFPEELWDPAARLVMNKVL